MVDEIPQTSIMQYHLLGGCDCDIFPDAGGCYKEGEYVGVDRLVFYEFYVHTVGYARSDERDARPDVEVFWHLAHTLRPDVQFDEVGCVVAHLVLRHVFKR